MEKRTQMDKIMMTISQTGNEVGLAGFVTRWKLNEVAAYAAKEIVTVTTRGETALNRALVSAPTVEQCP